MVSVVPLALPQSVVCERGASDHDDHTFAISHSVVLLEKISISECKPRCLGKPFLARLRVSKRARRN